MVDDRIHPSSKESMMMLCLVFVEDFEPYSPKLRLRVVDCGHRTINSLLTYCTNVYRLTSLTAMASFSYHVSLCHS